MIKAPYNFVPLNEKVFYPEWGDKISHDVPFKDGESGVIEIEIEAKSPIFIRNHYEEGDDYYIGNNGERISKEFCHVKNEDGSKSYFIPASSFKGMVRNVLEIMSFAEIMIDENAHKKILAVRDMRNRKFLMGTANGCGFLIEENGKYYIKDCGKILTISYKEIEKFSGVNLRNFESAEEKYSSVTDLNIPFKKVSKGRRKIAVYDRNGKNIGRLVFTNKIQNKKNEFVFKENGQKILIDKKIVDNFKQVYFEDENSVLGQYWKNKQKIPVFYVKVNDRIINIGLTQLFKIAYNKTILQAAEQKKDKNRYDLPKVVFGVDSKIKGRVFIHHFFADFIRYENTNEVEEILGSPKPTYYPNYIEQIYLNGNKVRNYTTLMDKNAKIRGYKRYPIQPGIVSNFNNNDNQNVSTLFKPLEAGVKFKGKIRFFNLKKAEIGALLSAITFHGREKTNYHNLGAAKPLGYGKIAIKINLMNLKYTKEEYLQEFEKLMDSWRDKPYKKWIESVQIKELFIMSNKDNNIILKYQRLEPQNEFDFAKKNKEYLIKFSKLKGKK